MSSGGFHVDLELLGQMRSSINDAIQELADGVGYGSYGEGLAQTGRGLRNAGDDAAEAIGGGHPGLAAAVTGFATDWDDAVRNQIQDGQEAADRLDQARQDYLDTDEQAANDILAAIQEAGGDQG